MERTTMHPERFIDKFPIAENNITKTGYRALFLLLILIDGPKTRKELLYLLEKDPIIRNDISKDSITVTINTLRKSGCDINRPTKKTGYKYILKSHPFNIKLKPKDIDALLELRDNITTLEDFVLLVYLNNLYEKLAYLAPDDESRNLLLYKHALKDIDFSILHQLIIFSQMRRTINIIYDSPKNGPEEMDFMPEHISFENEKLYVWGYHRKYRQICFLRVDRIIRMSLISFSDTKISDVPALDEEECIQYQLKGYSAMMYNGYSNEVIVCSDSKNEFPLTITAYVDNRFNFFQRVLSYGTECRIVSPEYIRQEFVKILRNIKAGYKYD